VLSFGSGEADAARGRAGSVDSARRVFTCPCMLRSSGIKSQDQMTWHLDDSLLCGREGQFWLFLEETEPRKTAESTAKHRDGSVGSVVANHRVAVKVWWS